jgi:hypothetical protein
MRTRARRCKSWGERQVEGEDEDEGEGEGEGEVRKEEGGAVLLCTCVLGRARTGGHGQ